ncbi:MAG: pyridoxamine 5'-phosphate oxidase family protein [Firmicutes bacterium]|nr:pyridoxamine 5'-phosphate oxidase family protein [Bacillota bacterium]
MTEVTLDKEGIIALIEERLKEPKQQFVLSTLTADGYPDSRLMGNICDKTIDEVYFTCQTGSRKLEELDSNAKASVYFTFSGTTVWLYGNASYTRDEAIRKKIWNDRMLRIYPEGVDSPRLTVIKFETRKVRFSQKRNEYIEFEL